MKQLIYIIAVVILSSCHKEISTQNRDDGNEQCKYLFVYNNSKYLIGQKENSDAKEISIMKIALNKMLDVYGKEQVSLDQPFILKKENDNWYLSGTVPHDTYTGTVHVILDDDCKIIKYWHEE